MGKLIVFMSMSLDGFIAAPGDGPGHGLGVGGEPLHAWLTDGGLSPGSHRPVRGVDADIFDEMLATGAVVTGRRTFDLAGGWGGDHHAGVPVFVLTREGGDRSDGRIHFVTDPRSAVARAKESAGDRDVMMHGAAAVRSLLQAGLVDELALHLVPLLLGTGRRLFDDSVPQQELRLLRSVAGDGVMHLRYRVGEPPSG